ncbi:glutamine amidotransferase [Salinarimonas soli]|uniref:Cytoplasmic protein n=1 Tax=Salinarimonas soli TaxID=1638099 RepID=A0A5B2VBX7_9HYPH|nr:glutamine amidotransferase [Salinarimonas soli]KAA2235922.1 cytoplasmic protein [Salinarimonas soli]
MPKTILLAGESWTSTATHIKGWDQFASVTHHRGADDFIRVVGGDGYEIRYMTCPEAAEGFPSSADELAAYDVVVLSDIGANTLLLPSAVWIRSERFPNRLKALREYVARGGGLAMVGGYYSFQGINGGARYRGTPIADVLPVEIHPYDDRIEMPEGIHPLVRETAREHPILSGVSGELPYVLGVNEVRPKTAADTILSLPTEEGGHPLLVVGSYGKGRTAAWTTDIGPHWLPNEFLRWPGFPVLWRNLFDWLGEGRD